MVHFALDYVINYVDNCIIWYIGYIYQWVVSFCRRNHFDLEEDFLSACRQGERKKIYNLLNTQNGFSLSTLRQGLLLTTENGDAELTRFLIEKGADNLDECLQIACQCNRYGTAEILAQKGADIVSGLRTATSINIIRMLYRVVNTESIISSR
jgi:hypothetical protein